MTSITAALMRSAVVRVRVHLRAGNDACIACNYGRRQGQVKARSPDAGVRTQLEAPARMELGGRTRSDITYTVAYKDEPQPWSLLP